MHMHTYAGGTTPLHTTGFTSYNREGNKDTLTADCHREGRTEAVEEEEEEEEEEEWSASSE